MKKGYAWANVLVADLRRIAAEIDAAPEPDKSHPIVVHIRESIRKIEAEAFNAKKLEADEAAGLP